MIPPLITTFRPGLQRTSEADSGIPDFRTASVVTVARDSPTGLFKRSPCRTRFRERRAAGVPVQPQRPARPKSRPARWAAALWPKLRTQQAEFQDWRDQLPEALAGSRTAERLAEVCDLDIDQPRDFGRD